MTTAWSRGPVAEAEDAARTAVIDIGSNSVRLVVYGAPARLPITVFNEKVLCGLGRAIEGTGALSPEGVRLAIAALDRFVAVAREMGAEPIHAVATAAVRDAADGREFVAEVERRTGVAVRVIDGNDEARLSALGVLSGHPDAEGVVGDLGGGSLELVALSGGAPHQQATLPLGPLRLAAMNLPRDALARRIDDHLGKLDWLPSAPGGDFYPVGGAWRALARIHMAQLGYALRIIDRYTVPRGEIEDILTLIAKQSRASLRKMAGVPAKRVDTLPNSALLMSRLLERYRPHRLVFSAFGLREGVLYDALDEETRAQDPLEAGVVWLGQRLGRNPDMGRVLAHWIGPLLAEDSPHWSRVARAACHLSDIGWSEHPGYRAEHAFLRVLRTPVPGVDHPSRGYMALAVYARYGGGLGSVEDHIAPLGLEEETARHAVAIGKALRLGYAISGTIPGMLARSFLVRDDRRLMLAVPDDASVRLGETIDRRLESAAKAFDLEPVTVVGGAEGQVVAG